MRGLSHDFYVQPMNHVYIEAIAIYLFWTVTMLFLPQKARRIVSCIAAACAVGLIFMFALRLQASEASLKNMICAAGKRSEPVSTKLVYQARSVLICY